MPVRVMRAWSDSRVVTMLMMLVVNVFVLVLERLMSMLVHMILGEMQPHT